MTRKRGRPGREYRLRVRAERRESIDFEALARAALEQAAMDQREGRWTIPKLEKPKQDSRNNKRQKDVRHDRLA